MSCKLAFSESLSLYYQFDHFSNYCKLILQVSLIWNFPTKVVQKKMLLSLFWLQVSSTDMLIHVTSCRKTFSQKQVCLVWNFVAENPPAKKQVFTLRLFFVLFLNMSFYLFLSSLSFIFFTIQPMYATNYLGVIQLVISLRFSLLMGL